MGGRWRLLGLTWLCLTVAVAGWPARNRAQEDRAATAGRTLGTGAPAAARILRRAPDGIEAAAPRLDATGGGAALLWSDDGLHEEPGRTRAGGTIVRLRGRYRPVARLVRQPSGSVSMQCTANPPLASRAE